MSPAIGNRLGPCEIPARLGAGGMGEVGKARDTRLDRLVAIQTPTTAFSATGSCARRARWLH